MQKQGITETDLLLTEGSEIYHLHLKPGDIGKTVYLVGDPGRVEEMSQLFDTVDLRVANREFVTHTGTYNKKRVSVLSTGIGTDNIEIVLNELDAITNIDLKSKEVLAGHTSLNLIRIGTTGALQSDIEPGSTVMSGISGGLDNVMHFYRDAPDLFNAELGEAFQNHMNWNPSNSKPYFIAASEMLAEKFSANSYLSEITLSAPGFYAPQGRSLRGRIMDNDYLQRLTDFRFRDLRITNFEMESSALYGISRLLGHNALTICTVVANRISGKFLSDYHPAIKKLLKEVLDTTTHDE